MTTTQTSVGGVNVAAPVETGGKPESKAAHESAEAIPADGTPAPPTPPFPPGAVTERSSDQDGRLLGVRAPEFCRLTGITYRQLDYWTRTGRIAPVRDAAGSGTQRLYGADEIIRASLVREVMAALDLSLTSAFHIADSLLADRVVAVTDHLYLVRTP